ncbi:MAG: N-acetylneuraminate synthase [Nitrospirae bacterium]|nr:N-acetylneuraminate synthase [Nitrospirota bacterium]
MKTFIIAEAGVNHNGDINTAIKLVDIAVEARADAVKFQTFKSEKIVTQNAPKAKYQVKNTACYESQLSMLKRFELTYDMHKQLISYCTAKNIIFLSTPFDNESADMLDNLGVDIFKISSAEITNKPLIQHIARKIKPIILSTGMSYIGEVEKSVQWINDIWNTCPTKPQLTLLHCVSNYPSDVEDTNLLVINTMQKAFGLPVGYSDHTIGFEISLAAVAVGAKVIEKHFTIDRQMSGPDHNASLEPDTLKAMVMAIRNIETAMGDGIKRPMQAELETRDIVRKSLVASRDIQPGQQISSDDLVTKRPGNGILPEFQDVVIGMIASCHIAEDSVLRWEDLRHA